MAIGAWAMQLGELGLQLFLVYGAYFLRGGDTAGVWRRLIKLDFWLGAEAPGPENGAPQVN